MTDNRRRYRSSRSTSSRTRQSGHPREQRRRHHAGPTNVHSIIEEEATEFIENRSFSGENDNIGPAYAQDSIDVTEALPVTNRNDLHLTSNNTASNPESAIGLLGSSLAAPQEGGGADVVAYDPPMYNYNSHPPNGSSDYSQAAPPYLIDAFAGIGTGWSEPYQPHSVSKHGYATTISMSSGEASYPQLEPNTQPDGISSTAYGVPIALSPSSLEVEDEDVNMQSVDDALSQDQGPYIHQERNQIVRRWSLVNNNGSVVDILGQATHLQRNVAIHLEEEQSIFIDESLREENINRYVNNEMPWTPWSAEVRLNESYETNGVSSWQGNSAYHDPNEEDETNSDTG
ncbi:hypothetical protein F4781DRAFT_443708 [Annulohypoxylon bovei var. microspora]|nr:hypothetical protein F4781DRAFT_443708 [Annulohypoxylon bovei var. microspora]